jgi:hypothetical protein
MRKSESPTRRSRGRFCSTFVICFDISGRPNHILLLTKLDGLMLSPALGSGRRRVEWLTAHKGTIKLGHDAGSTCFIVRPENAMNRHIQFARSVRQKVQSGSSTITTSSSRCGHDPSMLCCFSQTPALDLEAPERDGFGRRCRCGPVGDFWEQGYDGGNMRLDDGLNSQHSRSSVVHSE